MAAALDELPIDVHVLTTKTANCRLKWTLTEYSKLPNDTEFVCPEIKTISHYEWQLIFKRCGRNNAYTYLYFVNNMQQEIILDYEVTLYTSEGVSLHSEKDGEVKIPKGERLDIIPDSGTKISGDIKEGNLIILCDLTFHGAPRTIFREILPKRRKLQQFSRPQKLLADLKSLIQKQQNVDVILLVGEEQIKCHKCILSARSPVFEKMFQHGIENEDQKTVRIDDVKFPALQKLIDFIYCGVMDAELDIELTYHLYYAADKYEILELRDMCADTFTSNLSVDNAICVLLWADRHNDDYLKGGVNDFIRTNFEVISGTEAWNEFVSSHTKVAAETIKHITNWFVKRK